MTEEVLVKTIEVKRAENAWRVKRNRSKSRKLKPAITKLDVNFCPRTKSYFPLSKVG